MGTILTSKPSQFLNETNAFTHQHQYHPQQTRLHSSLCLKLQKFEEAVVTKERPRASEQLRQRSHRQSSCWCVGCQISSLHWYLPPAHPPTVRCWCLHPLAQPGAPSHTTPKSPTGGQSPMFFLFELCSMLLLGHSRLEGISRLDQHLGWRGLVGQGGGIALLDLHVVLVDVLRAFH